MTITRHIAVLLERYPDLTACQEQIESAFHLWEESFRFGGKTLICGNGGSAADSEHIVGELMKGFLQKRPLSEEFLQKAKEAYGEQGEYLASHLQGALPAISLVSQQSLITAFGNDVSFDLAFAQQVYGYGQKGDFLAALSTSGNAKNVVYAVQTAKLLGLKTLGLTGLRGGKLEELCDVTIRVPDNETYRIQERHQAIYHTLCLMLEEVFFYAAGGC